MVGVAVRGQDGEWQRVGQTERVSNAGGRDVSFAQPVSINVNPSAQYRFAVYDIRSLVNEAAFLHITDSGLLGEATVSGADLASGKAIDVVLQKDGQDTSCRLRLGAPSSVRVGVTATGKRELLIPLVGDGFLCGL